MAQHPVRTRLLVAGAVVLFGAASFVATAAAADKPISGKKLQLKRSSSGKEKLTFQSKDPAFLFPAIASADNPATGSPGGLRVELFALGTMQSAVLDVPPGVGKPGWKVSDGNTDQYKYTNSDSPLGPSPLKTAQLKQGKMIKLSGKEVGLVLAAAQGGIAIRITTGSLRNCAVFGQASIKRDQANEFNAANAPAPAIPDCSNASLGLATTTTTTTVAPTTTGPTTTATPTTTTSSTLPEGAELLDFTTALGSGVCGVTRDGSNAVLENISCGGLNIGGGGSAVPEGLIPDGATSRLLVTDCVGDQCQLGPAGGADGGIDCTDTGCPFGPPLPIPNAGLSTCVVNSWAAPAAGAIDKALGTVTMQVPLSTEVFLTGNGTQPCPRCSASGAPGLPGTGTCDRGANAGGACLTTNSQGLSRDCRPGGSDGSTNLGIISVNLSPLITETATLMHPAGVLCPGQTGGNLGCFGTTACRSIAVDGLPAGPLVPDQPQAVTLASTFCIPAVGNGIVDGAAGLPGPGAASLPGTVVLRQLTGPTTTSTTSVPTTTTTQPVVTTTVPTTTTTTTTLLPPLPPLLPLTVEFASLAGTGSCGTVRNGSGTVTRNLDCGDLAIGSGNSVLPPSALPDGAVVHFELGSCSILPLLNCALEAVETPGTGFDCTTTGCFFGAPVPIPNGALSACSVNQFSAPASGSVNLLNGTTTASTPLALHVFLTGNDPQPCPRCSATGSPAAPGTGTCDRGANAGGACTTTNSQGLSKDCLPGGADGSTDLGFINANLSPVTTGTASISNPSGLFCPGQTTPGCFGDTTCRSVTMTGSAPASPITSALTPQPATLVSTFCVPGTGNALLDGPAGLPGPAVISLPGQVRSQL